MKKSDSHLTRNNLKALEAPFSEEVAGILEKFPQTNGYLLKLFRMWANSPRHLKKFSAASLLDKGSPLSIREREIVILRTTALKNCEYEWGVHVTVFAEKAGLSKEQIQNTLEAETSPALWASKEHLLLNICDELQRSGVLSAETKATFQLAYSSEAQLEIFALCGFYTTVAFTANNSEIGLEPFAANFQAFKK